jgi:hypothetical protein
VNEIFRDLASIVHDQGEVVGEIFRTIIFLVRLFSQISAYSLWNHLPVFVFLF